MTRFPKEMGGSIGGLTFEEVFCKHPNVIEFVDTKWFQENTTGLFLLFFKFVKNTLQNPRGTYNNHVKIHKNMKTI